MSKKISEEISEKVQGSTLKKEEVPAGKETPEQAKYKGLTGWGGMDTYAYAVKNVLDQSRHMKGSERGWLGKEKQTLNPNAHVDRELVHGKKKKK